MGCLTVLPSSLSTVTLATSWTSTGVRTSFYWAAVWTRQSGYGTSARYDFIHKSNLRCLQSLKEFKHSYPQVECLCCFQHSDVVPAIAFHPLNDNYFLSGSLDGKLRLWYVPTKKVKLWNEVSKSGRQGGWLPVWNLEVKMLFWSKFYNVVHLGTLLEWISKLDLEITGWANKILPQVDKNRNQLITAINFCEQGKKAVVGTYDGRIMFYDTEGLTYYTQKEMVWVFQLKNVNRETQPTYVTQLKKG